MNTTQNINLGTFGSPERFSGRRCAMHPLRTASNSQASPQLAGIWVLGAEQSARRGSVAVGKELGLSLKGLYTYACRKSLQFCTCLVQCGLQAKLGVSRAMTKKAAKAVGVFDFKKRFPTEAAARDYLERLRWPDGIECVACEGKKISKWKPRAGHYQCRECRKVFSVRAGAVFDSSRIGLQKWLYAIYLLRTARKGISSLYLSNKLGITQKSAWFMLHRLREACDVQAIPLATTSPTRS